MKSGIAKVAASAFSILAAALCVSASGAGLENDYVSIAFGEKGEITSIRNKATGRELVKKPIPFAVVTLKDGKTKLEPARFAQKGDRLGWSFPGGGGLMLSVRPFAGGWTFTSEKFTVKDAESCEYFRMSLVCDKYKGKYAHMMSDDADAVCVRSYGLKLMMPDPGGHWGLPKIGHYLPVTACAEWGFTGHKCGLSAGPKDKIQKMLQAMTLESGAPMSTCGGAWCLGADANRHSYVFSYYDGHNFDEWLNMLDVTGIGTIHFHLWYFSSGNYDNINTKKFPKGLAGLKEAADRVHAAGHRVSLHTLSALIAGPNPWVGSEANAGLQSVFRYTTLNDLKKGVTELLVKERPDDDMDTSVTYGSLGNYLRLGSEIVQYTGIRREEPYAFTGITRGAYNTKVVDHPAGTTAHYLRARYYGIYPDADSSLMDEIAAKFAKVANTVGIDRVYFDGAEGIGPRYGRIGEYQIATMLNKLFGALDQSRHPIQAEVSCLNSYTWWLRANGGAIDGARYGRKVFDRDHIRRAAGNRASNLLEPQCGWWAPGQRTDETDYFMSHVAGVDGAMSLYGWVNEINKGPLGMHGQSELTVLGWYEHFRMAKAFNERALQKYLDLESESRLRQDANGVWQVEPYDCLDHRIDHAAKRRWTVERAAAGAAEPAIYVLGGSAPYDDPSAIPVVDGADAAAMAVKTSDRKIEASVSSVAEKGRGDCLRLSAVNRSKTRDKTWAHAGLKFAKPRNCAPSDGVGFWVKGDGKGAMLNVRLHANGPQDCLVKLDFVGWRYFEFLYEERDCQTWSKYKWPVGGGWNQFTGKVDPKAVATVDVMLADIPVEGEKNVFLDENADAAMAAHEGVEVVVSEVRALPKRTYTFTDVTLSVNGRKFALPFDTVESNDRIFLKDGFWTLRDAKGELKRKVKTADRLSLKAGANALSLTADAIEGELRADVTLFALGEKFPALRPTADWPEKWASHGMYEAMLPVEYCPRKGAVELPDLTVRPGERAAVEIHLVGDVKGPWLEYGAKDGVKRLTLPDGKAGTRVKFQGPVLSGVRPLAFGCADPDAADVRIEIVKRYTGRPAADEPPARRAAKEPTKWELLAERMAADMKANGFTDAEIEKAKVLIIKQ